LPSNPIAIGSEGWDLRTFSVQASFRMSKQAPDVRIEVSLDDGGHWDDISGFPRNLRKPVIRGRGSLAEVA
jgi:hypothetical protein